MICSYYAHERNWCQVTLVLESPINLKNSYLSEHGLKILHEYGEHAAIPGAACCLTCHRPDVPGFDLTGSSGPGRISSCL
jgi:hypothetical protein